MQKLIYIYKAIKSSPKFTNGITKAYSYEIHPKYENLGFIVSVLDALLIFIENLRYYYNTLWTRPASHAGQNVQVLREYAKSYKDSKNIQTHKNQTNWNRLLQNGLWAAWGGPSGPNPLEGTRGPGVAQGIPFQPTGWAGFTSDGLPMDFRWTSDGKTQVFSHV